MIILTGTTGGLGAPLLTTLLSKNLLPPSEIIISSANPSSPSHALARSAGIEIRYGDMTKPETLLESYRGAEVLYLTSYPSTGFERYKYHKACIDAAKQAGVKHIIYTSLLFGGLDGEESHASVMQAHISTVAYLKASGLTWTVVREATYAHLWNNFAGFVRVGDEGVNEVVVAGDGRVSWADRRELGEGTAFVVAGWRNYINKSIALTGPELLTVEDIVNKYTNYTNRPPITFRKVGAKQAIEYHEQRGSLPPEQEGFLRDWTTWGEALENGEMNFLDPTLETLLGRKAKTIDQLARVLFRGETNGLDTKDFN
ncbi:hypothetical protein M409DRAFT_60142 [Zasmidium cellare ATCC 36951]|uniref:NAD(P)-binding domain-containing protein n=1 Tax=Zasmidium cellare ATCC 36951 TaxID=1080233 RepID=A0A6A6BZK5_ZASCE|nr:uncharacterized protein M409DRAFT_60142 [Zasmidium cellare ATCC 36951]KAF2160224.1 hypothetical protein M409DRAFT_60142 [Zasmidium cellare ATCC 36951]